MLVSLYTNACQRPFAAQGAAANTCNVVVLGLQEALSRIDVPVVPVTVKASLVTFDGQQQQIGSLHPAWGPDGLWSGHVGMWLSTFGRFCDPTIYQANRPGLPTIATALVVPVDGPEALDLIPGIPKDGWWIRYECVGVSDEWRTGLGHRQGVSWVRAPKRRPILPLIRVSGKTVCDGRAWPLCSGDL